jgi:hypothetical protein
MRVFGGSRSCLERRARLLPKYLEDQTLGRADTGSGSWVAKVSVNHGSTIHHALKEMGVCSETM